MSKPINYATETEAEAVLRRTGYSKNSSGIWQSPHGEQLAFIKTDDAHSHFWIEFKSCGFKYGPNA